MGGQPPVKVTGVGESIMLYGRQTLVLVVDARENPGGHLRLDPAFAFCQAPFLMTFAMGGIPHAGSRQVTFQGVAKSPIRPSMDPQISSIFLFPKTLTN